jgi:hypothetical protein
MSNNHIAQVNAANRRGTCCYRIITYAIAIHKHIVPISLFFLCVISPIYEYTRYNTGWEIAKHGGLRVKHPQETMSGHFVE